MHVARVTIDPTFRVGTVDRRVFGTFVEHMGRSTLQSANNVRYDLLMAGAVIASVPVLLLYVFAQRFIIEGVSPSGVKRWSPDPR